MTKRSFIFGSEWLYYKIYLGPKTADIFLSEAMLPFVNKLKEKDVIEKWFFIRYADPKPHLRIRFLAKDINYLKDIIHLFYKELRQWHDADLIWKVQLDTYNRELERYGNNTMELSESIFYIDSNATLFFLNLIEGDQGEQLRWLYGIKAIDNLLNVFNYKLSDKLFLLDNLKTGFGQEFNMSRPLKKQLDNKYRQERSLIEDFMVFTLLEHPEYEPILDILDTSFKEAKPIAQQILVIEKENQLQFSVDNLMGSYIHMLMNRLFKSKNRLNEMVCYDFLFRYYKSKNARVKNSSKL